MRILLTFSVLAGLALVYWYPIRKWYRRWGMTDAEVARTMAGDAAIADPPYQANMAITIAARPAHIWPWLVQIGYRRGGLYSYDWLDRLFGYLDRPSAERILPEFQQLAVGDVIPIGTGSGFPVVAVEQDRALVLGGTTEGTQWSWEFGLYPLDEGHTRLVSRSRVRGPKTVAAFLVISLIEPAAFIMTRKMLLGLKRRAETLATTRRHTRSHAA